MVDSRPFVSAIIPAYNAARFLPEAVESIRRQNYEPLEIIVVDDGSADATADVARGLGDDIRYVPQANRGPAAARNHGLRLAQGEVIAFLDADDLWPDDKLEVQMGRLLEEPHLQVILGMAQYVRLPGARHGRFPLEHLTDGVECTYLSASIFRREAFEAVGPFDESLWTGEDQDWFLRAMEKGIPMAGVKHVTHIYRLHTSNMTLGLRAAELGMVAFVKRSLDRRRRAGGAAKPLPALSDFFERSSPPAPES